MLCIGTCPLCIFHPPHITSILQHASHSRLPRITATWTRQPAQASTVTGDVCSHAHYDTLLWDDRGLRIWLQGPFPPKAAINDEDNIVLLSTSCQANGCSLQLSCTALNRPTSQTRLLRLAVGRSSVVCEYCFAAT